MNSLSHDVRLRGIALGLILGVFAVTATLAMRRTSTTFDEIAFMAAGARGFETGRFDLIPDHPPLPQYLYGLPVYLARPRYPVESEQLGYRGMSYRYTYAQSLLWKSGNDPERLTFLARLAGILCAGALVFAIHRYALRWGGGAALLSATLAAFLPDLIAHAGVAYSDVPLALFFFLTIWATDRAARSPGWRTGAVAGLCLGLSFAVKFSAVALGPIVLLIVAAEARIRRADRTWPRGVGIALLAASAASYALLVLVYRGDPSLADFRQGLALVFLHVDSGHDVPGYLLGHTSPTGWWYFFPVAFLYKTPAALHALMVLAGAGFVGSRPRLRALLGSPLRGPVIGILVFGAALVTSSLDIGFRYALPVLPLVCVLTGVGVARLWASARGALRVVLAVLPALYVASTLSFFPFFLSYLSEYGSRAHPDAVLLDSSVDWGQGLLALRDFMRDRGIDRIYLSYFGSALPEGYGIRYVPLPSMYPLGSQDAGPASAEAPRWVVISATNLHGLYLGGTDPFERYRAQRPDTVLARTLFVFGRDGARF